MNGFVKFVLHTIGALLLAGSAVTGAESSPPAVSQAVTLLQAGKADEALALINEALKADGQDPQLRFAKAMILLQARRSAEALPLAEALAKDDPDNPKARLLLGRTLTAAGRPKDAVPVLAPMAESGSDDGDALEAFAEACLETAQPIRAQRALLRCLEVRAGAGSGGGLFAAAFTAAAVGQDMRRFREERTSLIFAYAVQNHEAAIEAVGKFMAAGDVAFRTQLAGTVTRHLGERTNFVSRAVVATVRGEPLPEQSAKDAAVRRIRAAGGQAMFTVGCLEANFAAANRKRGELLKAIRNETVEESGKTFLQVTLKADVDSKLTLDPKGAVAEADLQSSTGAVAAIALEIQRQRQPDLRQSQPLRLRAETGTYEFEVTAEDDELTLTRKPVKDGDPFEQEFDLEGRPPHLFKAF